MKEDSGFFRVGAMMASLFVVWACATQQRLVRGFQAPTVSPDAKASVTNLVCRTFCSQDKLRTGVAELSWSPVLSIRGAVEAQGLETTVYKDGFKTGAYVHLPFLEKPAEPSPGGGRCSIAVSPDESYVIFVVSGTSIFESDDGGTTFILVPFKYA